MVSGIEIQGLCLHTQVSLKKFRSVSNFKLYLEMTQNLFKKKQQKNKSDLHEIKEENN